MVHFFLKTEKPEYIEESGYWSFLVQGITGSAILMASIRHFDQFCRNSVIICTFIYRFRGPYDYELGTGIKSLSIIICHSFSAHRVMPRQQIHSPIAHIATVSSQTNKSHGKIEYRTLLCNGCEWQTTLMKRNSSKIKWAESSGFWLDRRCGWTLRKTYEVCVWFQF